MKMEIATLLTRPLVSYENTAATGKEHKHKKAITP